MSRPGRVTAVDGGMAEVERQGRRAWFNALLQPEVRPGDWVLTHTSLVLEVITGDQAAELEELLSDPPPELPPNGGRSQGGRTASTASCTEEPSARA